MKQISFLIKPASGMCDMRCRYCFYADVAQNRTVANLGLMTHETADALIEKAFIEVEGQGVIHFAFQGGEPTVAGLEFFEYFVQQVIAVCPPTVQVHYAIQTNGISIHEAWAAFLHKHHFLVGLSLDGDAALHDAHRIDAKANGTYKRVMKALCLLQKYHVEVNALCVVTRQCAKHPHRVYQALKKTGIQYLQFIPCLDPLGEERGGEAFSLTSALYGEFLCGLFDVWYRDWAARCYTSIRLFDDYVHLAMGLPSGSCATSGRCGGYFVVEGDGGVYPCDFYVLDEWKLGNVQNTALSEMLHSERLHAFLKQGESRPQACAVCEWQPLCRGGCQRDWQYDSGGAHHYYCEAYRRFFAHASPRLAQIAQAEQAMRQRTQL